MTNQTITAAAVQLDTIIGDTMANLAACRRLALQAVEAGATWIGLPEFFNTGVIFEPTLVDAIEPENGVSASFMRDFSKEYGVVMGGSFMCAVPEGGVRNRYLCFDKGELVGRHDKDYPTMIENAFYEGGESHDTGVLGTVGNARVGTAVCWEFMRTGTSRRLRGNVDVIIGGSHWWSIPENFPKLLFGKMEKVNEKTSLRCVQDTARLVGVPVIHASHCNKVRYMQKSVPIEYVGQMQGNAAILDAHGNILAQRNKREGEGIVVADITLGSVTTSELIPDRFWLHKPGWLSMLSWYADGFVGRRWYKKHVKKKSFPV